MARRILIFYYELKLREDRNRVVSIQEKKIEALKRMKTIADHFNLGDKLVNYSMDTINYDERYAQAVKVFERKSGAYVYHVIEAKIQDGYTFLSLLFVNNHKEDWQTELLDGNSIFTYTICIETPSYNEMGWGGMASIMGYLMRMA